MGARTSTREAATGPMTIPVRLDSAVLRGPLRGLHGADRAGFLTGVWIALTAVVGTVLVLLSLAAPLLWVQILSALVCAVPGGMALLRGVVDAVSPRGRLPAYRTSTVAWLLCYLVAAGGLLAAFAAP